MVCSKTRLSYPLFRSRIDNCKVYLTWKSLQSQRVLSGMGSRSTVFVGGLDIPLSGKSKCFTSHLLTFLTLPLPVFLHHLFMLVGIQMLSTTEKPSEDMWQFQNGKKILSHFASGM